ncbi:MAG: LysR family transcriptional regulator [Burkholderiales bacterium]|nr:LysR family transcriptional regulator [Burkholderiales bacterium]
MRRKIPSTAALAAFEAAARHGSYTGAAEELAVTQSAVCRQIATLEAFVGVKLFRRSRRGVLLTDAGELYGRSVRARLEEIERDTLSLMASGGGRGVLEIGVVPTFATEWLLPRLPDFHAAHPDITLNLTTRIQPFLFEGSGLDAALHAGGAPWPGSDSLHLMRESLVAVASPVLLQGRNLRARLQAADVARLPLLQMATRPQAWRAWFEAQGLQVEGDLAGPRMDLFSMLIAAASCGQGAALVPQLLAEPALRAGRLRVLVPRAHYSDRSYRLIYPQAKAHHPALVALRDWLDTQARAWRAQTGLD